MPAKAGIHDFSLSQQRKPWTPAFAGMTTCAAPVRNPSDTRYYHRNDRWRRQSS
jgi:hypothetical protein